MKQLVFLLEEPSAKAMLKGVLPSILPENIDVKYHIFSGKQDLRKRCYNRLRVWQQSNAKFIVMCDQDVGDCQPLKQALMVQCQRSGKTDVLVRIACRELEAFYLGDLQAVECAMGVKNLAKLQQKAKYRDPDQLQNPAKILKKLVPNYQKVSGSRSIGPHLNIQQNTSKSFQALIAGIQRLLSEK